MRQHKEITKMTDTQVKKATDKSSNKLTGNFPACMRRENNREDKMRRNDDLKGKGGGRLKHCNVDGDVPLCLQSSDDENKDSSSKKNSKEIRTSESKDMCGKNTEKKNKKVKKVKTPHSSYYRRT